MSARSHIHPTWDGAAAGPARPTDVVDAAAVQAERLRRAVGFRVDGPEGRIGRLRAFVPGDVGGEARMRVDVGLFIPREVGVPVGDVRQIDPQRRRILVAGVHAIPRRRPAELARCVRRFVRASGGRTAGD